MPKVIDLELDLPPAVDEMVEKMQEFLLHSDEKGMANYGNIFGPSRARSLEFTPEEIEQMRQLPEDELEDDCNNHPYRPNQQCLPGGLEFPEPSEKPGVDTDECYQEHC